LEIAQDWDAGERQTDAHPQPGGRCIQPPLNLNSRGRQGGKQEDAMAWTTPTLVEICIGLEINGYLPAEF
jgi:coenzyme PQQ precursor peptide PqqA